MSPEEFSRLFIEGFRAASSAPGHEFFDRLRNLHLYEADGHEGSP